jgi:Xaa-Pro aminopeptidase
MAFSGRLSGLRRLLREVDGFLVADMTNVRYLTGFTGTSGFVLLTREDGFFVTDFRYALQAEEEVTGLNTVIEKRAMPAAVKALVRKTGVRRLGVEDTISMRLHGALSKKGLRLKAFKDPVGGLRAVKHREEIDSIREAVRRAEAAFLEVKPHIRAGAREAAIGRRLETALRRKGSRRIPFDIIVASGPNSAMPHAGVTGRALAPGDLVVIDWGGEAGGYFSDMTRTFLLRGGSTGKKKEIYKLVLRAQMKGIEAARAGVSASEIDNAARDVIKKAGYGLYFGHGLGHGVGLEVHEKPRISRGARARVKENMVFTVEPGVYVPGVGGVRIEDMVMATRGGADVLTSLPRRLEVL